MILSIYNSGKNSILEIMAGIVGESSKGVFRPLEGLEVGCRGAADAHVGGVRGKFSV